MSEEVNIPHERPNLPMESLNNDDPEPMQISRSAGSFMDSTLARNLKFPTFALPCPLAITAVDGQPCRYG